jgi:uncharacterized protein YbbC (DUF1343 family)
VTDRDRFEPLATSVTLLLALKRLYPDELDWRREPYEFVDDRLAIDLLSGDTSIRDLVDGGGELPDLKSHWRKAESLFREAVASGRLYA